MKKINKILLVMVVLFIGLLNVKAEEKVKVYVFGSNGCPHCTAQREYLTNLNKTNNKFEMVYYELDSQAASLCQAVASKFYEKGYANASCQYTPMVIVGSKYAQTGNNENLEVVINQAYEEQQPDIVKCVQNNQGNCDSLIYDLFPDKEEIDMTTKVFLAVVILGGAGYFLAKKYKTKEGK